MKGTIVNCLRELICERHGEEQWRAIMRRSGLDEDIRFMYSSDVEDRAILGVIDNACVALGITRAKAADTFGDYWINTYAVKIYKSYFAHFTSFRQFMEGLDELHQRITDDIPNAHPPRFEVVNIGRGHLRLRYVSSRGLTDFAAGLVRGIGRYFNLEVEAVIRSPEELEVRFHE